jgi:hypothetical protein
MEEHHTPHLKVGQLILRTLNSGRKLFSKEVEDVREMFKALDRDGGGGLSKEEFREGMQRLGVWLGPGQAVDLFAHIDTDGDSEINANEFVDFLKECKGDDVEAVPNPKELDLCTAIEQVKDDRLSLPFMVDGRLDTIQEVMALNNKLRDMRDELSKMIGVRPAPKALGATHFATGPDTLAPRKSTFNLDTRAAHSSRMGMRQPQLPVSLINPRGHAGRRRSFVSDKELLLARVATLQRKRGKGPKLASAAPMVSSLPTMVLAYGSV